MRFMQQTWKIMIQFLTNPVGSDQDSEKAIIFYVELNFVKTVWFLLWFPAVHFLPVMMQSHRKMPEDFALLTEYKITLWIVRKT